MTTISSFAGALPVAIAGLALGVLAVKPVHVVRLDGFWDSVYWTMRSWVYDYPITGDYTVWNQEGFGVGNEET